MTVGEDLVLGLQTLVLGMVVTFVGLLILQGVMMLMARFSKANGRPSSSSVASDSARNRSSSPLTMEKPAAQVECAGLPDEEMAVIHIEKADAAIPGLYPLINREFILHAWKDVKLINREEDMGLEGLRKAKMSYNPVKFLKKYAVSVRPA